MATQYYGEGEGNEHKEAKKYLCNFFRELLNGDKKVVIKWKEDEKWKKCTINKRMYNEVSTETPIGNIRPDIVLWRKNKKGEKLKFLIEIYVSNQVDTDKEQKIQEIKNNSANRVRVFEFNCNNVCKLRRDIDRGVQRGGGTYHILHAIREII